jgi:sRNA-binding carbon storage regulator CsrA
VLVLTFKLNEVAYLTLPDGRRVEVMLTEMEPGKAKIGFTAPADVRILRARLQAQVDAGIERHVPAIVADKRRMRERKGGIE